MESFKENSNVVFLPIKSKELINFGIMDSLLRYVYSTRKNSMVLDHNALKDMHALEQSYYCRAALKRRLKQIAMQEHELHD